jgi:hypothetical protein
LQTLMLCWKVGSSGGFWSRRILPRAAPEGPRKGHRGLGQYQVQPRKKQPARHMTEPGRCALGVEQFLFKITDVAEAGNEPHLKFTLPPPTCKARFSCRCKHLITGEGCS